MRRLAPLAALWLAACEAVPRPFGEGVTFHTVLSGGYRALDHDEDVFDGHAVYGLAFATREDESGLGYELGGTYGSEDAGGPRDHSGEFDELYLGLRKSWAPEHGSARPYVALGGALTRIENEVSSPNEEFDHDGASAYLRGGVLWAVGPMPLEPGTEVLLGLDVRGVLGDDSDAAELALVLGFGR